MIYCGDMLAHRLRRIVVLALLLPAAFGFGAPFRPFPPPLSLEDRHRLLVVAPHCDDETLGSAGLILACRRAGLEIKVVLETNGDGFLFATMGEFRKIYPSHQDFIRMGGVRQQESLCALRLLGVTPEEVSFLGYPDRGTPRLWEEHWSVSCPYPSPYSGYTASPYPLTYNTRSVYAGENLLADLVTILRSYKPDLISLPHPNDLHPDHWGLSVFTRLAVVLCQLADPGYRPKLLAYLVHRHDFPVPKGFHPAEALLPPPVLYNLDPAAPWFVLELSPQDLNLKEQAVRSYASQTRLLNALLEGFVRGNELFELIQLEPLPRLAAGILQAPGTWRDPDGHPITSVQRDPVQDQPVRKLLPGADLLDLHAARRRDGSLAVCASLRGVALGELQYILRVSAVGAAGLRRTEADTGKPAPGRLQARVLGRQVTAVIPLEDLGQPWVVAVEAEVREPGLGCLDRTAWTLLEAVGP
jgi:LmbE family N-acetylglucosaminyl deacetylase